MPTNDRGREVLWESRECSALSHEYVSRKFKLAASMQASEGWRRKASVHSVDFGSKGDETSASKQEHDEPTRSICIMTNSNDNNNNSTANLGTDPDPATAAAIAAALQEDTSPPTTRSTRSSANKRSASQEQQQQPETKRSKSSNGNGGGDVKGLAAVEEAKRPNGKNQVRATRQSS